MGGVRKVGEGRLEGRWERERRGWRWEMGGEEGRWERGGKGGGRGGGRGGRGTGRGELRRADIRREGMGSFGC